MAERGQALADPIAGSAVYPIGSRVNERGHLEVGGCDAVELAAELGTPAYVYAEDDMRARARTIQAAFAERTDDFEVVFASKAFPCTAALRLFAEEGLSCDVASGGELHLALNAGFDPERIYMHGNNKSAAELEQAVEAGVGHIIVDSLDEIDRLGRIAAGRSQRVLLRATPGIRPDTHDKIATGQEDSKFGIPLALLPQAAERCAAAGLEVRGLHAHIGSQVFELDVYETLAEVLGAAGEYPVINMGGGFAVAYTRDDAPPPAAAYAQAMLERLPDGVKVLCEPGRSLVANAGLSLYTVGTVKDAAGGRRYVAVDGGMADNIRPMLYDAVYEAEVADRIGDSTPCRLVGMHCESGDVLIKEARLEDPRVGDIVVVPATGAYGYAMASNYNGVPRPPVVFCRDGEARSWSGARPTRTSPPAMSDPSKPVRIGLLGRGTVGGAFAELLAERADAVEAACGRRPQLSGVLTRSEGDFEEILAGSDLIVELIGGTEPAREHVLAALRAGRPVVTANKQLLAQHGDELFGVAREAGVQLRFEAAVAGVIPIVRVIQESFGATEISKVFGIVNGTTNFILSEMAATGAAYEEVLARAQELGYAEADPTDDVNGADAAAKMAILARLAFHTADHARRGRLRGDRDDPARRPRLRQGARPLAEAARRRRAARRGSACASSPASSTAATRWRRSRARSTP